MRDAGRSGGNKNPKPVRDILRAIWDGARLRCPTCRSGPIYRSFFRIYSSCPECGAPFEREGEGDFLGAMTTAYALTAVLVVAAVLTLNLWTDLTAGEQAWIVGIAAFLFVVLFYRNMKGIWVGVLHSLLRWLG